MKSFIGILFAVLSTFACWSQSISLTSSTYTQNFNSLASTGTSSTTPSGWYFIESGSSANTLFSAGNGSSNTGDTYSFGNIGNSERALGGLQSGGLDPKFGAYFTNTTGCVITSLSISYTGETWRIGATGRSDRLDFQYSTNATSLTNGTWTDINSLDYTNTASGTAPLSGSLLQSESISGSFAVSIPISGTFWIRWTDFDAAGADDGLGVDDFAITPTILCNTISVTSIVPDAYTTNCSSATSGSLNYSSSGTYNSGNIFTVQLSDGNGSFLNPLTISTISGSAAEGTSPSGTISYDLPQALPSGTGYRIRIVSSNPVVTGLDNGVNIPVTLDGNCTPPSLTSVMINSCTTTCQEGANEIVFGNSGDYSFEATASDFNFSYGETALENLTDVVVNNSTQINNLNTAAGCPGLFVDGTNSTIPPNSSWMLVNQNICVNEALTWDALCGSGPIYVIFSADPGWTANTTGFPAQNFGNFSNNPGAPPNNLRYWETSITTTFGTTLTINYTTDGEEYLDSDGVFATFDPDGGPATLYGDDNCSLTPVLLPSFTVNFNGYLLNNSVKLNWSTSSEQNNDYFTVLHSTDGQIFESLGTIPGAGNSSTEISYSFIHDRPQTGINYYKLKSTDYDGTTYEKGLITIMVDAGSTYFDPITSSLVFAEEGYYEIITPDGRTIGSTVHSNRFELLNKGVILVRNLSTGSIERLFIP